MVFNASVISKLNGSKLSLIAPADSQCLTWLVVFIAEFLAIALLNITTIIVFVKKRQLLHRSTYLILHPSVVDLLFGAVASPVWIAKDMSLHCYERRSRLPYWFSNISSELPIVPRLNLLFVSLERAHATFCPFRHRFIKKWVFAVIIIVIWTIYGGILVRKVFKMDDTFNFAWSAGRFFPLCVVCNSYVSIFIKIRCSRHPQRCGAVGQRERKLTKTLILVTLGSLLTCLPMAIYCHLSNFQTQFNISEHFHFHPYMILLLAYFAGSLSNPILYALRIPAVRAGLHNCSAGLHVVSEIHSTVTSKPP